MKTILPILALAMITTVNANADENKMTCFVHKMTETGILSGFSAKEVSPDQANIGKSFFGATIEVDLEQARQQKVQPILKLFSSSDFKGAIQVGVSFWYQGGKLAGSNISLAHIDGDKTYASTTVGSAISSEFATKVELPSGKKGLIEATIECGVN